MKALVYHGPGMEAWEEVADPVIIDGTDAIVRVDATTICGTDLHILKGDVPAVTDGRILGHEAVGTVDGRRRRRPSRQRRRPRARLVHHLMWHLPVLPRRPRRPMPRRRRLDPRSQDRRHPSRARPRAVRRPVDLPDPGRRERRGGLDAGRHPADRLRGRRPQRPRHARRRRRRRGRRPDRPGGDHRFTPVQPDDRDRHRSRRQPLGGRQDVRRRRHRQQLSRGRPGGGPVADRRSRRRCRHRSRRHTSDVRAGGDA